MEGLPPIEVPIPQKAVYAQKYNIGTTRPVFAFIGPAGSPEAAIALSGTGRRLQKRGDQSQFLLIGDGVLAERCESFIKLHNLANVSRIPHCNVAEVYPLLSGVVVTSEYEGLPLVFLDTQACGVPALSTDVGDIRAIMEEHQSG